MPLATMRTSTSSGRGSSRTTLRISKSLNFSGTTAAVMSMRRCRLLRHRCLQDRRQPRDLAFHQRGERFRPAIVFLGDFRAEIGQALAHGLVVESLVERFGELVDHGLRRALGRIDRVERRSLETRQAGLGGGRHIRQQRMTLAARDGEILLR